MFSFRGRSPSNRTLDPTCSSILSRCSSMGNSSTCDDLEAPGFGSEDSVWGTGVEQDVVAIWRLTTPPIHAKINQNSHLATRNLKHPVQHPYYHATLVSPSAPLFPLLVKLPLCGPGLLIFWVSASELRQKVSQTCRPRVTILRSFTS